MPRYLVGGNFVQKRLAATTILLVAPLLAVARDTCAIFYDHELTQAPDVNAVTNAHRDAIASQMCGGLGGSVAGGELAVVNRRLPNVCTLCRGLDAGATYNHQEDHPDRNGGPVNRYT
ncbi:hypothetical protein Ptr902_13515 [Pyrenophora tritici-repentis]|nr:hypothetical protein Ptr902_13515 [Pyrenophora tritici-repentis]